MPTPAQRSPHIANHSRSINHVGILTQLSKSNSTKRTYGSPIPIRELQERPGLEKFIEEHLSRSRRGWNKRGASDGHSTSRRNPAISRRPARMANSLRRGRVKRTMRTLEVQVGNDASMCQF